MLGADSARSDRMRRERIGVVLQESQPEVGLTVGACLALSAGYTAARFWWMRRSRSRGCLSTQTGARRSCRAASAAGWMSRSRSWETPSSGVWIPNTALSSGLQQVASVFLIEHLASALHKATGTGTLGSALAPSDLLVLAAWGLAAAGRPPRASGRGEAARARRGRRRHRCGREDSNLHARKGTAS